jgi:Holliday junction resolvase RusA-like endonuclease
VKTIVRPKVAGCAPVEIPVKLEARVWVPDNRRRDVPNFAKCVHDALEKLVYVNDCWLYDSRWIRAGVDVDHPRAEITITPLAP